MLQEEGFVMEIASKKARKCWLWGLFVVVGVWESGGRLVGWVGGCRFD